MKTSKVNSGSEFVTDRDETVMNTKAGAIVFGSTTGKEKVHISHMSGSNINITNKVTSELAANNKQTLVLGAQFNTTKGDSYTLVNSNKEDRVKGDITVITGSDDLTNSPLADDWLEIWSEIAAAKAKPNWNYCAIGNNTNTVYEDGGTPDPESGAVEGGTYEEQNSIIPDLLEKLAGKLANLESQMGVGGSLKLLSGKHITLQAGPAVTAFDSGTMAPNKKAVTQKKRVVDGKLKEVKTSTSRYENTDTSNSIPFGDIHIAAGTKLNMSTGSGGISMNSTGEANLNAKGNLILGGAAVSIGAGDDNNAGRVDVIADKDIFVKSGDLLAQVSTHRTDTTYNQHTIDTPHALFTGDLEVYGDLIVHGNITVCGSTGIRVPNGDVKAGGVSLKDHKHSGVEPGVGNTGSAF
tara:strand:- start:2596 stop:3822 length:1227 start_codon:yes stop_codon:yes gene_type:complete